MTMSTQFRRIAPPDDFPYPSTTAYGYDPYGIWQTVSVNGVDQTFRWIPPGRFMMGSPEDETGRFLDEEQRQIILNYGFWMADTVCTQELWLALMGDNPSLFEGKSLPVESVSFDSVLRFCEKWENAISDFPVRLPTEVEWEYGCRSGTTTPFSLGDTIDTQNVNYRGNFPPSNFREALYRETTVSVKELACNSWGLYQMHGNVREWCFRRPDSNDQRIISIGNRQVLRGGSFVDLPRFCRSAYRSHYEPDELKPYLGFRLVGFPQKLSSEATKLGANWS